MLKDKIRAAEDIKKEPIYIPEWDTTIEVRTMSGSQRADIMSKAVVGGVVALDKLYAQLALSCTYDPETGDKLLDPSDLDWFMEKNSAPIERIAAKAMELSGLSAAAVREIEKNSGKGRKGSSTSN